MAGGNGAPAAPAQQAPQAAVSIETVKQLVAKALKLQGFVGEEVDTITEVLLYAQLRDNSQGLIKLTSRQLARPADTGVPRVQQETPLSALLDGGQAAGMVVMQQATCLAVAKARASGVGIVGSNQTSTGTGALGYYVEQVAVEGLLGFAVSGSPECVAPHGASEAVFGTNPIAVGVPATDGPLVVDLATSAAAYYALVDAKAAGQHVADDIGYDSAGDATTDPAAILEGGAIRTFDRSHKGSALALVVELLAGPLVGAAVADKVGARNWGNLVVAVDPGLLGDARAFTQAATQLLARVKGARPAASGGEVLLPGERSAALAAQRLAAGALPLPEHIMAGLQAMAAEYERSQPQEPASSSAPLPPPAASDSSTAPQPAYSLSTLLLHPTTSVGDMYSAAAPPLYQTATFAQPSATVGGPYDYTRSGNPTRTLLEEQMAELEGADRSFAFASGMAALAAVCRVVKSGEHIVAGDDLYGGTARLLSSVVPNAGVDVTHVDTTDVEAVKAALIPGRTKWVFLESPTNPRMQICDIAAISRIAHEAGALVMVDNSILAPTFQRPLDLGADICMTSATKFIAGHSDVTGGILSVRGQELAKAIYFNQNAEGSGLGPFDCWLALRGLKTMAIRMERQAANAAALARFLAAHPLVQQVNYPGLPGSRGYDVNQRQASSGGSLLSFTTGIVEASKVIVDETLLFKITVSFGSVSSLISLPCYMSHASIPAEVRAARGLPDDLVRISAGIEDIKDLVADLGQAMDKAMALHAKA